MLEKNESLGMCEYCPCKVYSDEDHICEEDYTILKFEHFIEWGWVNIYWHTKCKEKKNE